MSDINALVVQLSDHDGLVRQKARFELEKIGDPAVDALIEVLQLQSSPSVWEAAKALIKIRSPKAAPALVDTLENNDPGVRWVASEALTALGMHGLEPLMAALASRPTSGTLRDGAHHVLNMLINKNYLLDKYAEMVKPVLAALDNPEHVSSVQSAAGEALQQLRAAA
jgi:HEAT repeat protein